MVADRIQPMHEGRSWKVQALPWAVPVVLVFTVTIAVMSGFEGRDTWERLAPGLETAEVDAPAPRGTRPGTLTVVRLDPSMWDFAIFSARGGSRANTSLDKWAAAKGLAVAVNAGMYQADRSTSVGYMRIRDQVNNAHWHKAHKAVFVAGPRAAGLPGAAILDADCDDLRAAARDYDYVLQGIRMLSCKGENVWKPGGRSYSQVAAAVDGKGRVLFIFRQTPATSHAFVEQVMGAGLDVERMMYLEGGSEAGLYVEAGGRVIARGGLRGLLTNAVTPGGKGLLLPVPNVIGVRRK